ncbi:universal stress protein [Pseudoduganella sp. RAF53_2]|uniref:universal stress protein n=1 Tax=unclassified Pseudoduganella TaxID=2637179 RepID=UPI003F94FC5B
MSYKTILVHADGSRGQAQRIELAAALAEQEEAHLVCAAMTGISRYVCGSPDALANGIVRPDLIDLVRRNARETLDNAASKLSRLGVESFETRLVDDDAYGGLLLQSRYADLVILGQADRDDPATGALLQDLPEYIMLNGCRPVLVVPFAGQLAPINGTAIVAWDGSLQSVRAITQAIPLLRRAQRIIVALFDPVVGPDEHGESPGADIALYLARHRINVDVMRQRACGDTGEALLTMADRFHAGLLVMGAYGHSRFREIALGGVTRTVLNTMTLPVLLSH